MKDLKFKVESPEHSRAIQDRGFVLGFIVEGSAKYCRHTSKFLTFNKSNLKRIGKSDDEDFIYDNRWELATLNDLYNKDFLRDNLGIGKEEEKSLPELNGHQVELDHAGINVGCTFVSNEHIKLIYKASKANQKRLNPKPKKVDGVYEVGDIVFVKSTANFPTGYIYEVKKITTPFNKQRIHDLTKWTLNQNIRHATKKEIKQFKKSQNAK